MSSACAQIGARGQVNKMEEGVGWGAESTALDRVKIAVSSALIEGQLCCLTEVS